MCFGAGVLNTMPTQKSAVMAEPGLGSGNGFIHAILYSEYDIFRVEKTFLVLSE